MDIEIKRIPLTREQAKGLLAIKNPSGKYFLDQDMIEDLSGFDGVSSKEYIIINDLPEGLTLPFPGKLKVENKYLSDIIFKEVMAGDMLAFGLDSKNFIYVCDKNNSNISAVVLTEFFGKNNKTNIDSYNSIFRKNLKRVSPKLTERILELYDAKKYS